MSVLLTKGSDSCRVIGWGIGLNSDSVVSFEESEARLVTIATLASAMSLLRHCNSSIVGSEALLLGGFGCWWTISSVISGMSGYKLSTFCCALVAIASSGDLRCFPLSLWSVGVFGEFWAVNMGDTALLRIQVTFATLSSRERDKVDRTIDRSNERGLTRSCR